MGDGSKLIVKMVEHGFHQNEDETENKSGLITAAHDRSWEQSFMTLD